MNLPETKSLPAERRLYRKNVLFMTIFFFAINAFATLASYQFSSVVPKWIEYASFAVFTGSFAMFIYGFWLRSRYQLKHQFGFFTSIFLLLMSIHFYLISNISYLADQGAGRIAEQVNFLRFSLVEYVIAVALLSLLIYILSSPKLLFRKSKSIKGYVAAIAGGICLVVVTFAGMLMVKDVFFVQPETVKVPYEFLMASVIIGFGSIAVFILIYRSKKWGK
ncbi:hypothetical protein QNH39_26060 [Neobacillus novalis]|uniref:Uncharacterized protein n=1 Tax=Neobacillus novalis TaxID=220687 RepID=A0AA95MM13_9BACI|nr:hypothetical protein [Neobacillus novalis]WHY86000.1 hypothetical protein QNH39_26060 [Neobacillus novalis]